MAAADNGRIKVRGRKSYADAQFSLLVGPKPYISLSTLTLFLSHNAGTISFEKKRPPGEFSFQNRTVNGQAYDLIADS